MISHVFSSGGCHWQDCNFLSFFEHLLGIFFEQLMIIFVSKPASFTQQALKLLPIGYIMLINTM